MAQLLEERDSLQKEVGGLSVDVEEITGQLVQLQAAVVDLPAEGLATAVAALIPTEWPAAEGIPELQQMLGVLKASLNATVKEFE
eukprot:317992-Lingulodinium_polyedra.AAC.1